ncbi:hypothetical protein ACP4OV_007957 [Aristida adscensionis]
MKRRVALARRREQQESTEVNRCSCCAPHRYDNIEETPAP